MRTAQSGRFFNGFVQLDKVLADSHVVWEAISQTKMPRSGVLWQSRIWPFRPKLKKFST